MYSQRFGIVPREFKGPTPKVVLLRAKPPQGVGVKAQEERILHSHEKHLAILKSIKESEWHRLKAEWDQHNDRKFLDNLVQAKIKDAMQGFIINTEERRNKLRCLLASEENEYFAEMQLKEETTEMKRERMKEKTRMLKEQREKEKELFVTEKLDQQFREGCEELRLELSNIHQKKVCEERRAQVAFNEERRQQKLAEEQMFARLWEQDRAAKEQREARDAQRRREAVEETRLRLVAQIAAAHARRLEALRLKEEEGRLLENDTAQIKLENEQERLKKQKAKQDIRTCLQSALHEKMEHMQQEHREEQDLNMKLVQRALHDLEAEAEKKKQKREDMRREQKIYTEYIAQRRKEEKVQENELDRVLEKEKQKKSAEKDEQLKLEKEARKKLVDEVMCTRKLQVQEKLQRKAKEEEERVMEEQRINEGLKELNREDRENFTRRRCLAQEYREQLQMQLAFQRQAKEVEREELRREFEAGVAANKACQDRIQELLTNHTVLARNVHPMRKECTTRLLPP
ncbi:PREDICTED: coiled-coil domain-containing protein 11 [Elephantulus edwardii]|uniref:coiled-coil domain-containing protein 11 n=1 Tax=Elephantulus edwardii TaxID=28737 RepID=UPI0003F06D16|nr:PREDICTED: coiled-coil domain-containing protein 11 [Elephantulus edwardii]